MLRLSDSTGIGVYDWIGLLADDWGAVLFGVFLLVQIDKMNIKCSK